jgi:undecaprenyl-diphosphatase
VDAWIALAVGCVVSFVVSLVAIRFLVDFVKKHSFAPFGVYRIVLGAVVLALWLATR